MRCARLFRRDGDCNRGDMAKVKILPQVRNLVVLRMGAGFLVSGELMLEERAEVTVCLRFAALEQVAHRGDGAVHRQVGENLIYVAQGEALQRRSGGVAQTNCLERQEVLAPKSRELGADRA